MEQKNKSETVERFSPKTDYGLSDSQVEERKKQGLCNGNTNMPTKSIGRIFFDNIRYIPVGEKVTIKNYWETIDYKVVEHKVIRKDDSSELYIFPGKQKLVLVTCISGDAYNRHIVICEKE